jgi:hypothetical protein
VGDREVENDSVAVWTREGEDLGVMTVDQLIEKIRYEIASHAESTNPSSWCSFCLSLLMKIEDFKYR